MGLVDAHCHLSASGLGAPVGEVIDEARAVGVDRFVLAGTHPEGWARQAEVAERWPETSPVYGLHPWWAARRDAEGLRGALDALLRACRGGRPPVALGETGLDGHTPQLKARLGAQEESLRAHLALAESSGLPVVLHVVKAHDRALRVLREVGVPAAGGVVHGFSGSAELAQEYLRLGLHLSLGGAVTWPGARRVRGAAAVIPIERLLIESDSPDQAPHPHRGERNRPAWLPLVVAALAELRGGSAGELAEATAANAARLFRLG